MSSTNKGHSKVLTLPSIHSQLKFQGEKVTANLANLANKRRFLPGGFGGRI